MNRREFIERRRQIAKRWHPDAHPHASPEEKQRLGKHFVEEMSKLDRELQLSEREHGREVWPPHDDAWWDDLDDFEDYEDEEEGEDGEEEEEAEEGARQAQATREEEERAARAAEWRRNNPPQPWYVDTYRILLAPPVSLPLLAGILVQGSCSDRLFVAYMVFMLIMGYVYWQVQRSPRKTDQR